MNGSSEDRWVVTASHPDIKPHGEDLEHLGPGLSRRSPPSWRHRPLMPGGPGCRVDWPARNRNHGTRPIYLAATAAMWPANAVTNVRSDVRSLMCRYTPSAAASRGEARKVALVYSPSCTRRLQRMSYR